MITDVKCIFFSPTGGTKKVAIAASSAVSENIEKIDLCKVEEEREFSKDDVVVVAAPVFGGLCRRSARDREPDGVRKTLEHLGGF